MKKNGFDTGGFDHLGIHKNGTQYDDTGFDKDGYDYQGFTLNGFDRNGYDKNKTYGDHADFKSGTNQKQDLPLNQHKKALEVWLEQYEEKHKNDERGKAMNTGLENPENKKDSNNAKSEYYEFENHFSDGWDQDGNTQSFEHEDSEEDIFVEKKNKGNKSSLDKQDAERWYIYDDIEYMERKREEDAKSKNDSEVEYFDTKGFGRYGFNKNGTFFDGDGLAYGGEVYDINGEDKDGFYENGFELPSHLTGSDFYQNGVCLHKNGTEYDEEGYNHRGYNSAGYNREGFNDTFGLDIYGFNEGGFDYLYMYQNYTEFDDFGVIVGYDVNGFDNEGRHQNGTEYDNYGFNMFGEDKNGAYRDEVYFDNKGFNHAGNHFNGTSFNRLGFDANGFDRGGYDSEGYNERGFQKNGVHKNGTDRDNFGYDFRGYNMKGFQKSGLHINGTMYDENGYDSRGLDREKKAQLQSFDENEISNVDNYLRPFNKEIEFSPIQKDIEKIDDPNEVPF